MYSSGDYDEVPLSDWIYRRPKKKVKTKATERPEAEIKYGTVLRYSKKNKNRRVSRSTKKKRVRRVFDVDHCDTDDSYNSGYSSLEFEVAFSDADDEDENPSLSEDILREKIMGYMATGISSDASIIREKILTEEKVKISYWTARQAMHYCLVKMHGSYINSFSLVPELCRQLKKMNPGSIASWSTNKDSNEFEGLCIAYKASIDGFKRGCRSIIGLDSSLLNSMYDGVVLSATSVDANNGMYPIAVYICRNENVKTWNKFLAIIAPCLMETNKPITFIHGFGMGIKEAVSDNFGSVPHFRRKCARHMYIHMNLLFKEPDRQSVALKAMRAYSYNDHILALGKLKDREKHWIEMPEKALWARHAYDHSAKCLQMTNIFSAAFKQWIFELRCKPICQWVVGFEGKLNHLFKTRAKNGSLWREEFLVPRAREKLMEHQSNVSRYYILQSIVDGTWSVKDTPNKATWEVDLIMRQCSCGEWQIAGIPCVHAMAVLVKKCPKVVESYVHECYTVKRYKSSYAGKIKLIPSMTEWLMEKGTIINPPPLKVPWRAP